MISLRLMQYSDRYNKILVLLFKNVYIYIYIYIYVCVCVCVCAFSRVHAFVGVCIIMYVCVCVCLCVYIVVSMRVRLYIYIYIYICICVFKPNVYWYVGSYRVFTYSFFFSFWSYISLLPSLTIFFWHPIRRDCLYVVSPSSNLINRHILRLSSPIARFIGSPIRKSRKREN